MQFRAQVYCSIGLLGLQRRGCPRAIASIGLGLYVLLYFHELNRSDVECSSLILLFLALIASKRALEIIFLISSLWVSHAPTRSRVDLIEVRLWAAHKVYHAIFGNFDPLPLSHFVTQPGTPKGRHTS